MKKPDYGVGSRRPKRFPDIRNYNGRHQRSLGTLWAFQSGPRYPYLGEVHLLVRESTSPVLVLKNTCRSAFRISESVIYGSIDGHHPALAKFHYGEDVRFLGEQRFITTRNLRGPVSDDNAEGEDTVLHRLLLEIQVGSIAQKEEYVQHSVVRARRIASRFCYYSQRAGSCVSRVFYIVTSVPAILCSQGRLRPSLARKVF